MKRIIGLACLLVMIWTPSLWAKQLSVGKEKANVRSGPGTEHGVLWTAGEYYPVEVIRNEGKWVYVRDFEGDRGWIYRPLLETTPSAIVKVPMANIREGAGLKHKVVFQAEKGVSFKILEKQGEWIKVEHVDGDTGWVHSSMIWGM